ncbi:MAG: hypothetical protein IPN76_16855 [Saprospiraceae bacterium]|nr:hypothetical protein [Saprospiraceae bacterium]
MVEDAGTVDGFKADKIWFLNALEAGVDLSKNLSPFPGQEMFGDLMLIPVSLTDIYNGYNGWKNIKQVQATV